MRAIIALFFSVQLFFSVAFAQVVPVDPEDFTKSVDVSAARNADALAVIRRYKSQINQAARAEGLDPLLVAGSIAAEHARNVNWSDRAQDAVGMGLANAASIWAQTNANNPEKNLSLLLEDPRYADCFAQSDEYNRWLCVVQRWNGNNVFNILVGEKEYFRRFTTNFFNPNDNGNIGLSFGMGQMSPMRALMVDDRIETQAINFRSHLDVTIVFQKILDPNSVVYYIAATNKYAIAVYASAGFDISQNPGLVATLYNLGNEWYWLSRTRRAGRLPQTNDFGKWVNQHAEEIRAALR